MVERGKKEGEIGKKPKPVEMKQNFYNKYE